MSKFHCDICDQDKEQPEGPGGTGYGLTPDNRKACYECCAEMDKRDMLEMIAALDRGEKVKGFCLYLSSNALKQWVVSNWPGTLKILTCRNLSRTVYALGHRIGRHDVWFNYGGREWHGVNLGDNQIVRCKPLKKRGKRCLKPHKVSADIKCVLQADHDGPCEF